MPDTAAQIRDFVHRSLNAYLVLRGPDKKPISVEHHSYPAAFRQICTGLHYALDGVQTDRPGESALFLSPDELAIDILGQLDTQQVKYTIDAHSRVVTILGVGEIPGACGYQATLPLDRWASFVSGGLASLSSSNELPDLPLPSGTGVTEEQPRTLAIRESPIDGLKYAWIPAREFWMGAIPNDPDARPEELPRHAVRITRGFWISCSPVTVAAYRRFTRVHKLQMPAPTSFNSGWIEQDHPMVRVSWYDAVSYCQWASGRLPSEAEWEYAARGGLHGCRFPLGNDISPSLANYSSSRIGGTSRVGCYPPNGFGLYDLVGNVSEWCSDWFSADYYSKLAHQDITNDPRGPESGTARVLRGGSWCYNSRYLRSSYRLWMEPEDHDYDIGFRCVRDSIP